MEAVSTTVRQARAHHRHELRVLTYIVVDEGNGGIIRNLTDRGAGIQAVAALRAAQIVRLRFELRYPRVRIEALGEVMWANPTGQCGVRFLDLPPKMARQINEWIFGSLLESIPQHAGRGGFVLAPLLAIDEPVATQDGLLISSAARKVISLPPLAAAAPGTNAAVSETSFELDWLSQPLSRRSLAWIVDLLIVVAASLLFSLVFLSIAHEMPKWPKNVEGVFGVAIFVAGFYWGFFHFFAGASMGTRLARLTPDDFEADAEAKNIARFR